MIDIILDVICSIIVSIGCLGVAFLFVVYAIGMFILIVEIVRSLKNE